ncbi:MAG: hypothetical protein QOC80_2912 [Frankiaceae bacterium]|nr:hypothetical protein [Frankiaceae bacterium]
MPAPSIGPAAAPAAVPVPTGAATDPAGPVQPGAVATRPAVPLTALADFGTGVTATITGSRLVTSAGQGPGEIAGQPSVAFTVALTNASGRPVDLTEVTVAGYYGPQSTPASPTNGPPTAPFRGTLAKGGATSGTYTFLVPPEGRSDVQLQISYLADQPTVVLRGAVR